MTDRIKLVRNDTRPPIIVSMTDEVTGVPIAIDAGSDVVVMKFRQEGATDVLATITGTPITGLLQDDGTINEASPYDVAGAGGRVSFSFALAPEALQGDAGNYEAEVQITFGDTTVQTVYNILKFKLREDF